MNVALGRAMVDSAIMRDIVELIDAKNAPAEVQPGFVRRLKSDGGDDATRIRSDQGPGLIVNRSVRETIESLRDFVCKNTHAHAFRNRNKRFEPMDKPSLALGWLPEETLSTLEDGVRRLSRPESDGHALR